MVLEKAKEEQFDRQKLENRAPSVAHLLRSRVQQNPQREAYQYFQGEDLVHVTWQEYWDTAAPFAAGLATLGIEVGDRVSLLCTTRYEWVVANYAIMLAGAATTTVYPNSNPGDVAYIVANSDSRVVIAEDATQVGKLREKRHDLPKVARVVVIDPAGVDLDDWVVSVEHLVDMGREALAENPRLVDERIDQLTPDHLSTLIYTSGTTGAPKGAELPHSCFVYEGAAVDAIGILGEEDLQFLWLPLSHVFGNLLLVLGLTMNFPTCIDGRLDKIVDNLAIVKPTFMGAAPRIFEKAHAKIAATLEAETGPKAKLIEWAFGIGRQVAEAAEQGKASSPFLAAQYALADRLVLSKVRERFGGRIRFFISGSARLDPDLSWWFASVGMLIIEGYGLTETSAATTVNRPWRGAHQHGTIGWPLPGTEARTAADGELLVKGPGVLRAYHGYADASRDAFDEDGFFRTGDIGEIDDRGFIKITDRKKDVFKTSGGKYIAPSIIETHFKTICPYASQFVVLGNERNYAAALVTLDADAMKEWADKNGMSGRPYAEVVQSDGARALVQKYVDELNAGLNRWETIKRFTILPKDFTVDDGELTPSLKLRRKVVAEKFSDEIAGLYDGEGKP